MEFDRLEEIKSVLSKSEKPMSSDEIASKLDFPRGPMPWNKIQLELEESIARGDSQIVKKYPGIYVMRSNPGTATAHEPQTSDHLDLPGVITCYGQDWQRDRVQWNAPVQLIGSQMMTSTEIDFAPQIGFYALGWGLGKAVEFIGFSGKRTIGECLLEHTNDRLSGRWESFSFYGLKPILQDGSFGPLPESVTSTETVASILSILVSVVQPKGNRRYYDMFSTLEFAQK